MKDFIRSHSRLVWLDIRTQYSLSNFKIEEGRLEKHQVKDPKESGQLFRKCRLAQESVVNSTGSLFH